MLIDVVDDVVADVGVASVESVAAVVVVVVVVVAAAVGWLRYGIWNSESFFSIARPSF